jgi:hypothetical protein
MHRDCPQCQRAYLVGRRFCGGCRAQLARACTTCSFVNEHDDSWCGGCARAMRADARAAKQAPAAADDGLAPGVPHHVTAQASQPHRAPTVAQVAAHPAPVPAPAPVVEKPAAVAEKPVAEKQARTSPPRPAPQAAAPHQPSQAQVVAAAQAAHAQAIPQPIPHPAKTDPSPLKTAAARMATRPIGSGGLPSIPTPAAAAAAAATTTSSPSPMPSALPDILVEIDESWSSADEVDAAPPKKGDPIRTLLEIARERRSSTNPPTASGRAARRA